MADAAAALYVVLELYWLLFEPSTFTSPVFAEELESPALALELDPIAPVVTPEVEPISPVLIPAEAPEVELDPETAPAVAPDWEVAAELLLLTGLLLLL